MAGNRLASRYAKSLLDLTVEKGMLDAVQADMLVVDAAIEGSRELQLLLSSPTIKADKKNAILTAIFNGKVSELTMSFITLLTRKGRESALKAVVSSFIDQVRTYKGIVLAEVTSAVALDEATLQKVHAIAAQLAGKQIELVQKIDSALIGGFILRVGDKQVDQSVFGKIKSLKREFAENPYVPEL
ncbi:MAG TPA: ATP synthase F1 subunit delta [Flavobacteriales bacterium]